MESSAEVAIENVTETNPGIETGTELDAGTETAVAQRIVSSPENLRLPMPNVDDSAHKVGGRAIYPYPSSDDKGKARVGSDVEKGSLTGHSSVADHLVA